MTISPLYSNLSSSILSKELEIVQAEKALATLKSELAAMQYESRISAMQKELITVQEQEAKSETVKQPSGTTEQAS